MRKTLSRASVPAAAAAHRLSIKAVLSAPPPPPQTAQQPRETPEIAKRKLGLM